MFLTRTSLSLHDSAYTDIFLNQLIPCYSKNAINLQHLTTHNMTLLTYKMAIVLRYVRSFHPIYLPQLLFLPALTVEALQGKTCQDWLLSGGGRSVRAKISGVMGRPWGIFFLIFSERELTFTFAICCRPSVCRLSVCLSVCLSYVTFVCCTQAIRIFGNISTALGT